MLPILPVAQNLNKESLFDRARQLPDSIQVVLMDIAAYDLVAANNYLAWQLAHKNGRKAKKRKAYTRKNKSSVETTQG